MINKQTWSTKIVEKYQLNITEIPMEINVGNWQMNQMIIIKIVLRMLYAHSSNI